jgi:hypothetical protein
LLIADLGLLIAAELLIADRRLLIFEFAPEGAFAVLEPGIDGNNGKYAGGVPCGPCDSPRYRELLGTRLGNQQSHIRNLEAPTSAGPRPWAANLKISNPRSAIINQ